MRRITVIPAPAARPVNPGAAARPVIPAHAGIHWPQRDVGAVDPGVRRDDGSQGRKARR